MRIASLANVKARFSEYVKTSGRDPVVITRNGKAVAAIVPVSDEDDLERIMLAYSPKLRAILSAARRRIRSGQGISHTEFWKRVATQSRSRRRTV